MSDKPNLTESKTNQCHTHPPGWSRFLGIRSALVLGVLSLSGLAVVFGWIWLKEPARSLDLLAGDRQRLEAFLAAHDYEAFLRLMELQPPAVRAELPPEWLRRYDEIKPALLFTVREATTDEVIDSAEKYEAPLLSLRWSGDGEYLVDVLAESNRKVYDGQTGRLLSVPEQPPLLAETDAHWPLGQLEKPESVPKSVNKQLVKRLCFSFGHDPAYWHAQKQRPVLLMPSPDNMRILTSFAVNPRDVETWKRGYTKLAGGRIRWTFREAWEEKVAASRRCFNVWKAGAFPQ